MPAAAMKVRNLRPGERLPKDLPYTGFEKLPVEPEWVWVVESRGRVVVALFTCYAHGLLILLRIVASPKAPISALVLLFRKIFPEAKARGCTGYFAFLDDRYPAEVKLMRIVLRTNGGALLPAYGAWAMGSVLVDPEERKHN